MPQVRFEPTIPVFDQAKTVHDLGRPHTNCVKTSIKTWDKRDKSWRQHHDSDLCAAVFLILFVSTMLLPLRHVADIVSWLLRVLTHAGVRPTLDRAASLIGIYAYTFIKTYSYSLLWERECQGNEIMQMFRCTSQFYQEANQAAIQRRCKSIKEAGSDAASAITSKLLWLITGWVIWETVRLSLVCMCNAWWWPKGWNMS
jgi:hypothetical protein